MTPIELTVTPHQDDHSLYRAGWADGDTLLSHIPEPWLDLMGFLIARRLLEQGYDVNRLLVVRLQGADYELMRAPLGAAAATAARQCRGSGEACGSRHIPKRDSGMTETLDHTVLDRWRLSPISFVEECLCDPETCEPFVLLDAERAFLEHAFKLDADGRLLYPEQIYSCPKKSRARPRSAPSAR